MAALQDDNHSDDLEGQLEAQYQEVQRLGASDVFSAPGLLSQFMSMSAPPIRSMPDHGNGAATRSRSTYN